MNKKVLCAALFGGLAIAQVASAQSFDDRWYLTGAAGYNFQDKDRGTQDAPFGAIGLGKMVNPNWSFDVELNYQNPKQEANEDLWWSQYGISFDVRRHFMADRAWHPYLLLGAGYQRAEEEFDAFPSPNSPGQREDGHFAGKVGVGLQGDLGAVKLRTELASRIDLDSNSIGAPDEDYFTDLLASVGVVIPLGPAPVAPVGPAPTPSTCADKDDDGDGVNNCDDKCPGSVAGQAVGPDGCPVPLTIDLKGVNFDFDKSKLRPDAIAILDEAIGILQRYPQLRVEVAGHTDLCGSDAYNQSLSERRARAVYDYLTGHGVDASRLAGPNGYGESRPLENTPQTLPECKSERNRRTELNVQNGQ